jgi:hypothetical protein
MLMAMIVIFAYAQRKWNFKILMVSCSINLRFKTNLLSKILR